MKKMGKYMKCWSRNKARLNSAYEQEKEKGLLVRSFFIKEKNDVFRKKWHAEKENWLKIVHQLEKASKRLKIKRKSKSY